jgi:outer membrane biosynthesis protein TonB
MLAVAGALAGCGPIVYVSEVSRHASTAVDEARAAHADKYAPYWWTRATQYLEKAREVGAYADFQGANRFGELATEAATRATEEARIAARDPSKRPLDQPPDVAPAKTPEPAPAKPPDVAPAKTPEPAPAKPPAPAPAKTPAPAPAKPPVPARIAPAKDAR